MESAHELLRFIVSPVERAKREEDISAARTALGKAAFANAYDEGKMMTLDDAVAFALGES